MIMVSWGAAWETPFLLCSQGEHHNPKGAGGLPAKTLRGMTLGLWESSGQRGRAPTPSPQSWVPRAGSGHGEAAVWLGQKRDRRRALTEESRISEILVKYFTLTQLPGTPISLAGEMETWALLCLLQRVG